METKETKRTEVAGTEPATADEGISAEALAKARKRGAITADLMTRPSFMAAHTAMSYVPSSMQAYGGADMVTMYQEFKDTVKKVCNGDMSVPEALLMAQAMSLNSIYSECASQAALHMGTRSTLPAAEVLMRMALKAQAQCTQTLRVLGELKNPKAVAFIKQQNNAAGPQQVNNASVTQGAAPARAQESEESPVTTNELLTEEREAQDAATLDTGATSRAGREN
ncbi:hypothetical protein [Paraburkholderia phenoliruptrix]|uniref:hypothetical protein n=1 Tax=Paraburkholderia phenoliruptrix TaxID=252970 RepID=UPI001C4F5474|nr:hypothetical protein [Paraburkholderia phenoliruptrix]MBW0449020.1 hypothetical protein [Paraburkholderia phenoliruptrix]MBW9097429.1 hypothetical protein [Paraburkholderia phenoliruptrix]